MKLILILAASIHFLFACIEILPWSTPYLLKKASAKLPALANSSNQDASDQAPKFTESQLKLVSSIVKNAGIYNAGIGFGLLSSAWRGEVASEVALTLLAIAFLAGVFGTLTLRSPLTALQAAVGATGITLFFTR